MNKILALIMNYLVKHSAEIVARLQTKSPKLFKALQIIFGVLAVLATIADRLINSGTWSPVYADTLLTWCGYIIAIGSTGFGISALTVADTNKKEEKKEKIQDALSSDVVGDRPPSRKPRIDDEP